MRCPSVRVAGGRVFALGRSTPVRLGRVGVSPPRRISDLMTGGAQPHYRARRFSVAISS